MMSPELRHYLTRKVIAAQQDAARFHREAVHHMKEAARFESWTSWHRAERHIAEDYQRWAAEAHARAAMFMSGLIP